MILFAICLSIAILEPFTSRIMFPADWLTVSISVPVVNPSSARKRLTSSLPDMLTIVPFSPDLDTDTGIPDCPSVWSFGTESCPLWALMLRLPIRLMISGIPKKYLKLVNPKKLDGYMKFKKGNPTEIHYMPNST